MPKKSNFGLSVLTWGLTFGGTLFPASAARADQFAVELDEHGHRVIINAGLPSKPLSYWTSRRSRTKGAAEATVPPPEINRLVEKTATRHAVDPKLVHAIIQVESEYNPKAVSRKGALGLMQLLPSTASQLGVSDPFDPKQNIEGGVSHLKYLLKLFGGDLVLSLAAYNAGVNAVARYRGVPSFVETETYVRKVKHLYEFSPGAEPGKFGLKDSSRFPITRYVDSNGVIHFTNVQ